MPGLIERQGEWWLPGKPSSKVNGQMVFHPSKGISLDLQGSLGITGGKTAIILGVTNEPSEITLYKCVEMGSSMSHTTSRTSGAEFTSVSSSIHAGVAFVGGHFSDPKDMAFQKLSVQYTHLDEWADLSGFKSGHEGGYITHSFRPPETLEASVDDGLKISLAFGASESMSMTAYSMEQHASVLFECAETKHFETFRRFVECMQSLLTLLVSEPVFPNRITATLPESGLESDKKGPPRDVDVYLPSSFLDEARDRIHPAHMPAPLSYMKPDFEKYMKKWWGRYDSLNHIISLYCGTLSNPYLYLDSGFLSMAQAVESYHRLSMNNLELEQSKYDEKVRSILDSVNEKYRDFLEYRLKYGNEPNLAKRLNEVFKKYFGGNEVLMDYGYNAVQRIVDTRNYLTHYDPSLKDKRAQTTELYYLTQLLAKVLEIALLAEVGLDVDEAKKRAAKGGRFNHLHGYHAYLANLHMGNTTT